MALLPNIAPSVLTKARMVWKESIAKYGREIMLVSADELRSKTIKAFVKRPKIYGLFDRTEQSYDQEKYMLMVDADDFIDEKPAKFMRAVWDGEEHIIISRTEVDLIGTVFGYKILVKG